MLMMKIVKKIEVEKLNKQEKIELFIKFAEFYKQEKEFDAWLESLTEEESDTIYTIAANASLLDILP